jgi:hypothetical protein
VHEVNTGQLDPGLYGHVGDRVGQQAPQPQSTDSAPDGPPRHPPGAAPGGLAPRRPGGSRAFLAPAPAQGAAATCCKVAWFTLGSLGVLVRRYWSRKLAASGKSSDRHWSVPDVHLTDIRGPDHHYQTRLIGANNKHIAEISQLTHTSPPGARPTLQQSDP